MSSGSSSALRSGVDGLGLRTDTRREDVQHAETVQNYDLHASRCVLNSTDASTDLMLDCEGIAMLIEGIPRFPCGNAGGMGFWGLRGPLLLFFLCFLVSAGGLVFLRGFRCCWCCTRRLLSPRRKLSFTRNTEQNTGVNTRSRSLTVSQDASKQILYKFITKNPHVCFYPTYEICKQYKTSLQLYHFFGMLFTEWCLVRDVKHRNGALLPICKFGCATSKELLWTIQKDVCREQWRKEHRSERERATPQHKIRRKACWFKPY